MSIDTVLARSTVALHQTNCMQLATCTSVVPSYCEVHIYMRKNSASKDLHVCVPITHVQGISFRNMLSQGCQQLTSSEIKIVEQPFRCVQSGVVANDMA